MNADLGKLKRISTYPAARVVAPTLEEHFTQQLEGARQEGRHPQLSAPTAEFIEALLDAAFWASLRREEGYSPKISLAFLPPEQAELPMRFQHPLPLNSSSLVKLSPGVERAGVHLGVWHADGVLYIWGTTLSVPPYCLVLDVSEPGLLVVKHRRMQGFGKFSNVAVLIGDQVKVVDERSTKLPDCPSMLRSLLSFNANTDEEVNILIQLAVSMRAHGHGGSLLVVPTGKQEWQESIVHPIKYAVVPAYSGLTQLLEQEEEKRNGSVWQGKLRSEVESLAGLTAIDGATVMNDQHELLAFGAKIGRPAGSVPVEKIFVTEPVVGGLASVVHPSQLGGTRHLSAAQFVHDQQDSLALIASQDGQFTIFSWAPCEGMVQAHRIETLLL